MLYAMSDGVEIRESASPSAAVLVTVNNGHELVEISRESRWVQVGVARTGKVGWVPISKTDTVRHGGKTTTPLTKAFQEFETAFQRLNDRVRANTGVTFFTKAEDLGDGILQVTATDLWISGPQSAKESNVATINALWKAANDDLPVMVQVVDRRGETVMVRR